MWNINEHNGWIQMIREHVWCDDHRWYWGLQLKRYLHLEGISWVVPAEQNTLSTCFQCPVIWHLYATLYNFNSCIALLPARQLAFCIVEICWNSFFFLLLFFLLLLLLLLTVPLLGFQLWRGLCGLVCFSGIVLASFLPQEVPWAA